MEAKATQKAKLKLWGFCAQIGAVIREQTIGDGRSFPIREGEPSMSMEGSPGEAVHGVLRRAKGGEESERPHTPGELAYC